MKERFKHWKSTACGALGGSALFALIWFEKLPSDWITQSAAVITVIVGFLYKNKK